MKMMRISLCLLVYDRSAGLQEEGIESVFISKYLKVIESDEQAA